MVENLDIKSTIAVVLALVLCALPLYAFSAKSKAVGIGIVIPIGVALLYALLNLLDLVDWHGSLAAWISNFF